MPASSISSGPLSSPSSTPSPPPPRRRGSALHKPQAAHTANKQATPPHGLGSDSELSELTEEEQDSTDKRDHAPNAPDGDSTTAGDDESAEGTPTGGGTSNSTSTNTSRRAQQKDSATGGRRGGGRRKRSSLVPAPMWGWAESKTSNVPEEEEEEEIPGPPKVMEEEEDEEEGDEENEEGVARNSGLPAPAMIRKAKGKRRGEDAGDAMDIDTSSAVANALNGITGSPKKVDARSDQENAEEEEEPESEEAESEEDKNVRIRRPKQPSSVSGTDSAEQTESELDAESDGERRQMNISTRRGAPRGRRSWVGLRGPWLPPRRPFTSRRYTEDSYHYWKREDGADDPPSPENDDSKTGDDEESEKEDEKEDGDPDILDPSPEDQDPPDTTPTADDYVPVISSSTLKASTSPPKASSRVVDHTGPLIDAIAPIAAAAAASSIMAGSGVIDPPSPGTSTSSRSQSPEPATIKNATVSAKRKNSKAVANDEEDCDDKPSSTLLEKKEKPSKHVLPSPDMDVDAPEIEGDVDNEPSAEVDVEEPENEPEQEAEIENEAEVEVEADEPLPDDDLEVELESDLQPAHRAEALDVLATIELKFALLRERVYVEKMEGLAWEEKLVNETTHPELIHIQKELLKRRDKRLELASRKREYEIANNSKKKRVNECGTWSWWKLARDELQTDMIAESSRKRRRLERERRALERPQPIRRVPMPPSEVPPAPSLRKIVKTFPFADQNKPRNVQPVPKQGVYPELSGLSPGEINADLEVFFSNRRYGFRGETVMGFQAQMGPPIGFGAYDAYADHMGNPMVPPGRMPPQHIPPFPQQMSHPQGYAYPPGRMPLPPSGHGHGHPPPHGGPPPGPGPGMYSDEMMGVMPQVLPPHHYYGSQVNGGYPEGVPQSGPPMSVPPTPGHHGRRSPSPMNGVMNGKQPPPHGGWVGPGVPPGASPAPMGPGGYPLGPGQARPPKGEWMPDERRRHDYPMNEEEERERIMIMREREHREREREKRNIMEREREKERDMVRERDGMLMDMDREKERERHMIMTHRQGPSPPGPPGSGPPPSSIHPHIHSMPPSSHHHVVSGQHPRAPHHHHVVHHHHGPGQPSGSGGPPPPSGSILHSPRAPREYGEPRPGSDHGQYPTEVINLSSKHGPSPPTRDDYPMNREQAEFREREGGREGDRVRLSSRRSSPAPGPSSQSRPQSRDQGPRPPPPLSTENDRPLPTPFAMASSQAMQATSLNGTSSPRAPSGYDGHVRSPGHKYSSAGRSAPPTAGPSTPVPGLPLSVPSSAGSANRETLAISPLQRRPLPPQSPLLHDRERERERDRELPLSGTGGTGLSRGHNTGGGGIPDKSPTLQKRDRSPVLSPVKYGPPPPPSGPSGTMSERERDRSSTNTSIRSPSVGYKRSGTPVGKTAIINQSSLVSPRIGLSGPGRAVTPAGPDGRSSSTFASPSKRNVSSGSMMDSEERAERLQRERESEESKTKAGPGVPPALPPTSNAGTNSSAVTLTLPSKLSVPQMVDGP